MRAAVRHLAHAAVRRIRPPSDGLDARLEPVSRDFGLDRGQPIDRHYIAAFLEANRACMRGTALEVAEPTYASAYRGQLSDIQILHISAGAVGATLIGDLTKPETLPEGVADIFICTQVLPFIFDVAGAIRGAYRMLKPGGTILATVGGIAQISRYDMDRWGDYWRFTQKSARMSFEQVFDPAAVHVEAYGNLVAAKAFLDGRSVEDVGDRALLDHHDPDYPVTIGIRATRRAG
jgi:SAM-dependent methyltransferase